MMRHRPPRLPSRLTVSGTLAWWTTAATARPWALQSLADIRLAAAGGLHIPARLVTSADDPSTPDPDTLTRLLLDPVLNARFKRRPEPERPGVWFFAAGHRLDCGTTEADGKGTPGEQHPANW